MQKISSSPAIANNILIMQNPMRKHRIKKIQACHKKADRNAVGIRGLKIIADVMTIKHLHNLQVAAGRAYH